MTNNKMTTLDKIAATAAIVGLGGFFFASNRAHSYKTPTLIEEECRLEKEIDKVYNTKLLLTEPSLEEQYSAFVKNYSEKLNLQLFEIRSNPQYAVQKQQNEKDTEKKDRWTIVELVSFVAFGLGFGYRVFTRGFGG